jgi:hypothetical protein
MLDHLQVIIIIIIIIIIIMGDLLQQAIMEDLFLLGKM